MITPRKGKENLWNKAFSKWWSDWRVRKRSLNELSQLKCYADEELERIANDAGVSVTEIHKLVSRGPEAANLLLRRMSSLNLESNEVAQIEPAAFKDLKKHCALCESRRRCAKDLALNSNDPAWEDYCPNAGTLKALNGLPWPSRCEW